MTKDNQQNESLQTDEIAVLEIDVQPESLTFFTSILQYGCEFKTNRNMSLGEFVTSCPDFSREYLSEIVQTIFLDGTAIDDITTPLGKDQQVIALSAAMPGLAGAIFRRNGPHATLRSDTASSDLASKDNGPVSVVMKLFNQIAKDKGELWLSQGVVMRSDSAAKFFSGRTELHEKIAAIRFDGALLSMSEVQTRLAELATGEARIKLIVVGR